MRIVREGSLFVGALLALTVAAIAYFSGVGLASILTRALAAGVMGAVVSRASALLMLRVLQSRFTGEEGRAAGNEQAPAQTARR